MLRHQFGRVVQISGIEQENAADLLFGFSEGAVGDGHLAAPVAQSFGGSRALQSLQANEMAILAKIVVISQALLDEGRALAFRHAVKLLLVYIGQAKNLHSFILCGFTHSRSACREIDVLDALGIKNIRATKAAAIL